MNTLDEQFINNSPSLSETIFGSFKQRVLASLLDFLVLSPLAMGLTFYNILYLKSPYLFVAITLVVLVYKPFMEYKYSYTLGKKTLKIKVVGADFAIPTLKEILLRNIFNIVSSLFATASSFFLFFKPEFADIHSYMEYTAFVQKHMGNNWIQHIFSLFFIVDAIVLWNNKQKRSIHDKIANTYVVRIEN